MTRPSKETAGGGRYDPGRSGAGDLFLAPPVVGWLAVIVIACYAALALAPQGLRETLEVAAGVTPVWFTHPGEAPGGWPGALASLVGHTFVHGSILHVGLNMAWLLALGTPVARRLGTGGGRAASPATASALFLLFYFTCGIAGALLYVAVHPEANTLLIGASGAVSGMLGAVARFAFRRFAPRGLEAGRLAPLTDRIVLIWTALWLLPNLVIAFGFGALVSGGSAAPIAWEAHIGGYVFGLLAFPLFDRLAGGFRLPD